MFEMICQIPGPEFLLYFFLYFAAMVLAYRLILRHMDTTPDRSSVQSEKDNALEVAYLKNPKNKRAVLNIVLFGLCQRGFLVLTEDARAQLTDKAASNRDELSDLEKKLLGFFPEKIGVVSQQAAVSREVAPLLDSLKQRLTAKKLLKDGEIQSRERKLRWLFYFLAFFPGLVKLFFGISGGKRIAFLVVLLVLFHIVWLAVKPSLLTRRGKNYLKNLLAHYSIMRQEAKGRAEFPPTMDPVLTAALFGMGALFLFSEFSAYSYSFSNPVSTDSYDSSSSSSDSSSDSSSGGCGGGGCGGCGGCGGGGD